MIKIQYVLENWGPNIIRLFCLSGHYSKVRFLREGTIIWKGSINTLRRFKDDAREVREGFECGIGLSDFQDLKQGDIIETFEERQIERV